MAVVAARDPDDALVHLADAVDHFDDIPKGDLTRTAREREASAPSPGTYQNSLVDQVLKDLPDEVSRQVSFVAQFVQKHEPVRRHDHQL